MAGAEALASAEPQAEVVPAAVDAELLVVVAEAAAEVAAAELGIALAWLEHAVVVAAAVELAVAFVPAASSSFSSRYYAQVAEDVALMLLHHCTLRKILLTDIATLLTASPFEVTSSTNLGEH